MRLTAVASIPATYAALVAQAERLVILDSLSGRAFLGIFFMTPCLVFTAVKTKLPVSSNNFYAWYLTLYNLSRLRYYHPGAFEWLGRSLTYGKWQPVDSTPGGTCSG